MAMTVKEKQLRQLVVDTAETWVGTKQGDANHKKIIETYNSIKPLPEGTKMLLSWPWCAASVSAWAQMLGLTEYILPECSCNRMIKLYKSKNQWVEDDTYVPDMGDILFYAWKDKGVGDCELEADHVGIVKEVKNNIIYVIEGNYSKQVKIRQIKVNGKYIRGFATPDYKTASKNYNFKKKVTIKPIKTTTTTNKTDTTITTGKVLTIASTVPYLKSGDKSEAVRVMQNVLIFLGFSCGTSGADGSFGPATVKAVKAYQKAVGITQDGICGRESWKNMLLGKKSK